MHRQQLKKNWIWTIWKFEGLESRSLHGEMPQRDDSGMTSWNGVAMRANALGCFRYDFGGDFV